MMSVTRLLVFLVWTVCAVADNVEVKIVSPGVDQSSCTFPSLLEVRIKNRDVSEMFVLEKTDQPSTVVKTNHPENLQESFLKKIQKFQEAVEYRDRSNTTRLDVECHRETGRVQYRVRGQVTLSSGVPYNIQPELVAPSEGMHSLQEQITDYPDVEEFFITEGNQMLDRDTQLYERLVGLERHRRDTEDIHIDVVALVGYSVYQGALLRSAASTDSEKREEALTSLQTNIALLFNTRALYCFIDTDDREDLQHNIELNGIEIEVDIRFRSSGSNINIRLVGYFIEDVAESQWVQRTQEGQGSDTRLDGNMMLGAIWNYTTTADNFPSFDVVVAFEHKNLFSFDTNRYLYDFSSQSSICSSSSQPVVLVHYRFLFTLDAAAVTKGLGHALGALEDGDNNYCNSSDHFLMSASYQDLYELDSNHPYYFSTCSQQYFYNYTQQILGGGDTSARSCLVDSLPAYNVTNVTGILPGEVYNPDSQCRLVYGAQSYYCFHTEAGLGHKDVCKRLKCHYSPHDTCYPLYAAEGTSCGNKKWCESGECVYSDDAPVTDEVCIHGDDGGVDCDALTLYYPYYCYYSNVQLMCCQSCKDIAGPDEGCLYGDNSYAEPACEPTGCNVTSYSGTCCETCAHYRTTTSAPSTGLSTDLTSLLTTTTNTASTPTTSTAAATTIVTTSTTSSTTTTSPTSTAPTTSPSTTPTTTTPTSTSTTTSPSSTPTTTIPTSTTPTTTIPTSTTPTTTTPTSTTPTTTTTTSTTPTTSAARITTTTRPSTTTTTNTPTTTPTTSAITVQRTTSPTTTTFTSATTTTSTTIATTTPTFSTSTTTTTTTTTTAPITTNPVTTISTSTTTSPSSTTSSSPPRTGVSSSTPTPTASITTAAARSSTSTLVSTSSMTSSSPSGSTRSSSRSTSSPSSPSRSPKPSSSASSTVSTGSHVTKVMSSTKTEGSVTSAKHDGTEKSPVEQNSSKFTEPMKIGVGVGAAIVLLAIPAVSVVIFKMKRQRSADITEWNSLHEI